MAGEAHAPALRGRLFRKYVALFVAVVCAALAAKGLLDGWFSFQEQKALLGRIQHEQAMAAAMRIGLFVKEIQGQLGWSTQFPWNANAADDWQLDAERLLRQVEAITELRQLDAEGREQVSAICGLPSVRRTPARPIFRATRHSSRPWRMASTSDRSIFCGSPNPT